MYEMHVAKFLFEFSLRKMAEHIRMWEWKWRNQLLSLEWWTPMAGCLPSDDDLDRVWVRLLVVPLYLWYKRFSSRSEIFVGVGLKLKKKRPRETTLSGLKLKYEVRLNKFRNLSKLKKK